MAKLDKNYVVLAPYRLNEAAKITYKYRIMSVVNDMHNDIVALIKNVYSESMLTLDALPSATLNALIMREFKRWQSILNDRANPTKFVKELAAWSRQDLRRITLKANIGIEPVPMSKAFKNKMQSAINANVSLVSDISSHQQYQMTQAVMSSMESGRSTTELIKELQHIKGMTNRRVKNITNDQLSKITNTFNNQRAQDNGFTEGAWFHSRGGKYKRISHVNATGTVFPLAKGCNIDGEDIQTGQLIGCKCGFRIVYKIRGD